MPPLRRTAKGQERRVGVELEMGGIDLDTASAVLSRHVGANVEKVSRYEHYVNGDSAGRWGIELDFAYLKNRAKEDGVTEGILGEVENAAEDLIRKGAEVIVPVEVVGPPLPLSRLDEIEVIIGKLREAGARGTTDEAIYAFSMQFNPELPNLEAGTITAYVQAFLCLHDWLKGRAGVDLARRLTAYVNPFPDEYVRKVVDDGYEPNLNELIDDYLECNPTRNRALDMLPLFSHLDETRVRNVVDDDRIKPRPTLHYRLPNCEIDRAEWGFHRAWNDWLVVEELAAAPGRLDELCGLYTEFLDAPTRNPFANWADQTQTWLDSCAGR